MFHPRSCTSSLVLKTSYSVGGGGRAKLHRIMSGDGLVEIGGSLIYVDIFCLFVCFSSFVCFVFGFLFLSFSLFSPTILLLYFLKSVLSFGMLGQEIYRLNNKSCAL